MLTGSVHVDPAAGWFPHFLGGAERDRRRREPQRAARARHRRRRLGRGRRAARRSGPPSTAPRALVVALGVDAAAGDPESPLAVTADGFRAAGRALGALGLPTVIVQEGGYDLETIGGLVLAALTGFEEGHGWVTCGSARTRPRAFRCPAAQGPRTAAALAARGGRGDGAAALARARRRPPRRPSSSRTRDTSDVWLLDLERAASRSGLPPGASPMPYWDDTEPRISPDGSTRRLRRRGHVLARRRGGRPAAQAGRGAARRSGSTTRRWWSRSSATARRGWPCVGVDDPWPRRLATRHGDRSSATRARRRSPRPARRSPTSFTPRADLKRSRDPRRRRRDRRGAGAHRHAGHGGPLARLVAGRRDGRVHVGAARLLRAAPRRRRRERRPAAHHDGADFAEPEWHPDGDRLARGPRAPQPLRPRGRRRRERRGRGARPRRHVGRAALDRRRRRRRRPTRTTRRRRSCASLRAAPPRDPRPPRARSAARRTSALEEVTFPSLDGLEIPGFLFRPSGARPSARARGRLSARRPDRRLRRRVGRPRAVLPRQGLRVAGAQLPRLDGLRAGLRAANHGVWGVEDTRDCLAAADFLRTLDWVDGDRLGDLRRQLRLLHGAAVASPTTRSTASAARSPSTATATSSRPGRRATARASRTSSG